MDNILRIMNFSKTVRLVDLFKLENWHQCDPSLKSGLYAEWCDCHPEREINFFVIEKDGPGNAWAADVPRDQYSKLIPIAIMAI